MNNSFYGQDELSLIGFNSVGENVLISRKVSIYGVDKISIGSNVRIDDYCILSGKIEIRNYIHISAFTVIFASEQGVFINDYCTISGRCNIYGKSDDYSGICMTNPMIPRKLINVIAAPVIFEKHSIIGCGCTILPGCIIAEGTAVGCMSLVKNNTEPWMIYAGIPAKPKKARQKQPLTMEEELLINTILEE